MKQHNYNRFFRVFTHDTVVTEISTNDLCRRKLRAVGKNWLIGDTKIILCAIADVQYALPVGGALFFGYRTRIKGMEMAKAGALGYINSLIDKGEAGKATLILYRKDHYEDLNINLTYANIHKRQSDAPIIPRQQPS